MVPLVLLVVLARIFADLVGTVMVAVEMMVAQHKFHCPPRPDLEVGGRFVRQFVS